MLVPVVVHGSRELAWADAGEMMPDSRGIPTPTGARVAGNPQELLGLGLRVVLVPALATDAHGNRLGQGGGYYDRLLAVLPREVVRIALVGPGELLEAIPREEHDEPVDRTIVA